jgi:hypothetical protein
MGDGRDRFEHVSYRRTQGQSAAGKVGNSLAGLCIGPVFLFFGCALLWYNEGVAIKTHRSLNEALDAVVYMKAAEFNPSTDGKLIHTTHKVSVDGPAVDDTFGLSRDSISLSRRVETYQWVEHHRTEERKLNNGETETKDIYTYSREWREGAPANSGDFRHPRDHENSGPAPYDSTTVKGANPKVGAYGLTDVLADQITHSNTVPLKEGSNGLRVPDGGRIMGTTIYFRGLAGSADGRYRHNNTRHGGGNQIGDVRVSFSEVSCRTVSVLAAVRDTDLVAWPSKQGEGYEVAIVEEGHKTATEMISGAQSANSIWTWVKRAGGFLLNLIGFSMITSIITTTAEVTLDWIPFLGPMVSGLVNLGVSIANFLLASTLSVITAAIAWVFYRPVLGITMLVSSIGLLYVSSAAGGAKGSKAKQ